MIELRKVVNEAAQKADLFLMASGANPFTKGRIGEYFAEQHHIAARSDEVKKRMNNFFRIFVPEIFALCSNSPIHNHHITKWKSVRASMDTYDASKRVNPNIKPAPYLSMEDIKRGYLPSFEHEKTFEKKRKKSRYYDISPFTQKDRITGEYKPTLEIRLLDTHHSIPLTVAYGALFQGLAKKLENIGHIPEINIGHNRTTAIKNGISSQFLINRKMEQYFHYKNLSGNSAAEVIEALFDWLNPEIKELGYGKQIENLKRFLKYKRTLADWQIYLFSKKKDQFISELLQASMENFDEPPLPEHKIKFKFIEKEEGRKEVEWDEDIEKAYKKLEKLIQRHYTFDFRDLANSLLALREINPQMKRKKCKDFVESLIKKYSDSNFYYSLLLLETLFSYEETERDIYRKNAEKITDKFERGVLESKQVWESAKALTVVGRLGGEELDRRKHAERLRRRIDAETPSWVRAYAIESLATCGLDTSEELSNLKIALKEDHWECEQTDSLTATAIIYKCLNSIGYKNEKVVGWLKERLEDQTARGVKDILKTSRTLRALSEAAIK